MSFAAVAPGKLIVLLNDVSVERIKQGDPFTLEIAQGLPPNTTLTIGYCPDEVVAGAKQEQDVLNYVFRGYEEKPEDKVKATRIDFSSREGTN